MVILMMLSLVMVLKVCFPGFASEFSSSYGWVASPSQSLDSATLFADGFHFSGWVYGTPPFWENCKMKKMGSADFVGRHARVLSLESRDISR